MATQPLAERTAAISEQHRRSTATRATERANRWMLWGFISMFLGAAIGVAGKKLMHEDIVTVVGVLMSFAGMFLMVYPHLVPSRTKHAAGPHPQREELPALQPRKSLPKERDIDYVPSITERTTNLLENHRASKPEK